MKHHISWTGYLEAVMLLLVIYYAFVLIKYYLPHRRRDASDRRIPTSAEEMLPAELLTLEVVHPSAPEQDELMFEHQLDYRESAQTMTDVDELIGKAKQAIDIAAKRPYTPERIILELKDISSGFPGLKGSPHIPAIADVIIQECQRTGTATLTEVEVSKWWDDQ